MQHLSNTAHPYAPAAAGVQPTTLTGSTRDGSLTWRLPEGRPDIPTRILAWLAEKAGVSSASTARTDADALAPGRQGPAGVLDRLRAARQACETYRAEVNQSKVDLARQLASLVLPTGTDAMDSDALAMQGMIKGDFIQRHAGEGQPLTERAVRAITQDVLRFEQGRVMERLVDARLRDSPLETCGLTRTERQALREAILRQAERRIDAQPQVLGGTERSLSVKAVLVDDLANEIDDLLPPTQEEIGGLAGAIDADVLKPALMRLTRDFLKSLVLHQSLEATGMVGEAGASDLMSLKATIREALPALARRTSLEAVDRLRNERAAQLEGRSDAADLLLTLDGLAHAMKAGIRGQDNVEFVRLAQGSLDDYRARFAQVGSQPPLPVAGVGAQEVAVEVNPEPPAPAAGPVTVRARAEKMLAERLAGVKEPRNRLVFESLGKAMLGEIDGLPASVHSEVTVLGRPERERTGVTVDEQVAARLGTELEAVLARYQERFEANARIFR